ncbi:hypothetical protein QZJ98_19145, partial [Acinetobacter baumannii]|nr:hypothetical protein [Acinetobacter baumannii]
NSPNFFDEFTKTNHEKYILNLAHELAENYLIKI